MGSFSYTDAAEYGNLETVRLLQLAWAHTHRFVWKVIDIKGICSHFFKIWTVWNQNKPNHTDFVFVHFFLTSDSLIKKTIYRMRRYTLLQ